MVQKWRNSLLRKSRGHLRVTLIVVPRNLSSHPSTSVGKYAKKCLWCFIAVKTRTRMVFLQWPNLTNTSSVKESCGKSSRSFDSSLQPFCSVMEFSRNRDCVWNSEGSISCWSVAVVWLDAHCAVLCYDTWQHVHSGLSDTWHFHVLQVFFFFNPFSVQCVLWFF